MLRLLVEKISLHVRTAVFAKIAAVILGLGATAAAAVKPTAARISEITGWLPAAPAPVGRPASDRVAWDAVAARLPLREILVEADRLVNVARPRSPTRSTSSTRAPAPAPVTRMFTTAAATD